jgi:hypothetical protein
MLFEQLHQRAWLKATRYRFPPNIDIYAKMTLKTKRQSNGTMLMNSKKRLQNEIVLFSLPNKENAKQ